MRRIVHRILGGMTLLCFSFLVKPVYALNLLGAYELALRNDPTFRSATKDFEAGLESSPIGRSSILPKLAASYNQNANRATQWGAQYTGGPNVAYNWNYPSNYSYVQLTQPLFNLDAFARWQQGIAQTEFSTSKYLFNTQDLLIRVLQAYTDLLYAQDQFNYQVAERDAFLEQFKMSKSLNKNGEIAAVDVLESEAAYQASEAKVIDAKDMIENAKRKLESILGEPIQELSKISQLNSVFNLINLTPIRFEDWKERALANNAELKAATNTVEISKQEYRKNHAAHYPIVNMVAAFSTQTSNTVTSINQTFNQNYIGVQVNLPLYTGGEINARTNQAYSNYEKTQADYDVAKERIITELRKQYDAFMSGKQKIQALSAAEGASVKLVNAMRKSVLGGERINADVLLAEKGLFNTRRDLAQTKYNYLLAYLRVHQLGGSLDIDDFQKVASYFK